MFVARSSALTTTITPFEFMPIVASDPGYVAATTPSPDASLTFKTVCRPLVQSGKSIFWPAARAPLLVMAIAVQPMPPVSAQDSSNIESAATWYQGMFAACAMASSSASKSGQYRSAVSQPPTSVSRCARSSASTSFLLK